MNQIKKRGAFLLDMDGTLINSEGPVIEAAVEVFSRLGFPMKYDDFLSVIGRKWVDAYELIKVSHPEYRLPLLTEIYPDIHRLSRKKMDAEFPAIPGVVERLQAFAKDYDLAVISGSPHEDIVWTLGKLSLTDQVTVVLGAEDYSPGKPSAAGFLEAMRLLGRSPNECLVFEDSEPGILSGKRAGCKVVGIECTIKGLQDQSGADFLVWDWNDVTPEKIKKWL